MNEETIKLNITYPTKEKLWHSKNTFSNVAKHCELEPIKITRRPCGTGKAANRFYYQAIFNAPDDAESYGYPTITENINRSKNKHFKPSDFVFINNICVIGEQK